MDIEGLVGGAGGKEEGEGIGGLDGKGGGQDRTWEWSGYSIPSWLWLFVELVRREVTRGFGGERGAGDAREVNQDGDGMGGYCFL